MAWENGTIKTGTRKLARKLTVGVVAVALTVGPASAVDWDGNESIDGSFDGAFHEGANWSPDGVPGAADAVNFISDTNYAVSYGADATTAAMSVVAGDVSLNGNGATRTHQVNGDLTLSGGDLTLVELNLLATGVLDVNGGGALNIDSNGASFTQSGAGMSTVGPTGTLRIAGGEFDIHGDMRVDTDATIDFTAGMWRFLGGASAFDNPSVGFGSLTSGSQQPTVEVLDDASVTVASALRIGESNGQFARVRVSDAGGADRSTLTNSGTGGIADLIVGDAGTGELTLEAGGLVDFFDDTLIGNTATGDGTVWVAGGNGATRSHLRVDRNGSGSDLIVGFHGFGQLSIEQGARVDVGDDLIIGSETGSNGQVTVTGEGDGFDATLAINGEMIVGGNSSSSGGGGSVTIQDGARADVVGDATVYALGSVNVTGGELTAPKMTLNSGSTFTFTAGTVRAEMLDVDNAANVSWTGGTLHTGTVIGSITNQGGTLAPGDSPGLTTVIGGYTQSATGALRIEIAAAGTPGVAYDRLTVNGAAALAGALDVVFIDGFVPTGGDGFAILGFGGSVNGWFDTINLPELPAALAWDTSMLETTGELLVTSGLLLGDANNDGQVTGADLIAVQQNFGNVGPDDGLLLGDANDDGQVTGADLISVQQNFGNVLAPALSGTAAVPEPGTLALMALALTPALSRRKRP